MKFIQSGTPVYLDPEKMIDLISGHKDPESNRALRLAMVFIGNAGCGPYHCTSTEIYDKVHEYCPISLTLEIPSIRTKMLDIFFKQIEDGRWIARPDIFTAMNPYERDGEAE